MSRMITTIAATGIAIFASMSAVFAAETIEVKMLNKATDGSGTMVYEPALIRANPGDTIKFLSVDKGHNAEAMKGGIPESAEMFKSKANQDFEVTLEADGTYMVKCTPHYAVGMVALILVGDHTVNFEEAKKVRTIGKAKGKFEELFAEAEKPAM